MTRIELQNPLGSLKEVIEQNWGVNQKPELFCFGLLAAMDIKQIAGLAAPANLKIHQASERATAELKPVSAVFEELGAKLEFGE